MLVYDYVDPRQLTEFARELPMPAALADVLALLPAEEIGDIEAVVRRVTRTNRAAKFRSYDAETPIGQRDGFSQDRVLLPPLGQKLVLGEFERLQLQRLRGAQNGGQIADAIYDDTANNVRAIRARMALAVGDVLTDGKLTLAGENGLTIEADFGLDNTHIVNAGTDWDDPGVTWAEIVEEIRTWVQVLIDDGGEAPAVARTSSQVISAMVAKAQAANSGSFGLLTRDDVNTVLARDGLPRFEALDARVDVDGTSTRVLAATKILFMPENPRDLGYTPYGITAEGLELAEAQRVGVDDAPGIVAVVMKEGDPVRVWSKATAVAMPLLEAPEKLLVADVL